MKAIFLILKINLFCAFLILSACTATKDDDSFYDKNAEFFSVVYQTKASRLIGSSTWIGVNGIQRLQFQHADSDTNSEDTSAGKFTLQFEAYREPQLTNQSLCSGGYKGNFSIQDLAQESTPTEVSNSYDPMTPYNPGFTTSPDLNSEEDEIDPATGKPKKDKVYYFVFSLTVTESSFTAGCSSSIRPPSTFLLTVIRYPNGDLIVTNQQRALDHYFLPELVGGDTVN